ncbi:MAG: DUF3592 domain-containing protein [Chlorobi bacterium]|nr:DUF3592 domain-containing protein [Chlorobiota bacterium]MCI0717242.1 DUF3592 domain-containing protein [Chlorobiota bacterium]
MTQNEIYLIFGANALLSFTMLAIGIISYVRTKRFLTAAIETRGKVVDKVYQGSADGGGAMYSPKIIFTDRMGQEIEFTENWSSNHPDFQIGDEVIVLYDPSNPKKARRGGKKWKFFFIAWLIGGMGILFSSILIIVVVIMLIAGVPSK